MPFVVTCPNCSTKLKTPQAVPAGRSVTCPQCKAVFTLTEPAVEIPSQPPATKPNPKQVPPPPKPAAPPKPQRSVASALANLPSKREDIPAAEMIDDEPARSRRGRDRDDDDRPSTRRRRDDDEDDRPTRRERRNRDDDVDDRPRPRRGAARNVEYEDDDEEDRPSRRGSRPRSGKKRRTGLILGLAGGAVILLLLVGGTLFYFVDPFKLFGGPSSDMLAWAPADSQSITVVDMEDAQMGGAGILGGDRNGQASRIGLRPDEVESILTAGRDGGPFGVNPDVVVFKLKGPADRGRITSAVGGKDVAGNGQDYLRTRDGGAVHFPSGRIVVYARTESTMTNLLAKGRGKVVIDDKLRSALSSVDGTIVTASVGDASRAFDPIGMMAGLGNIAMNVGGPPFGRNPFEPTNPLNARAVSVATGARVNGPNAVVRYRTTYDGSDSATRVAEALRSFLNAQQVRFGGDTSWTVSQSGATVSLTMRGPSGRVNGSFMPGR